MRYPAAFLLAAICLSRGDLAAQGKFTREDAILIFESTQQKYRSLSCDFVRDSNVDANRYSGQYYQAENGWLRGVCKRKDAHDQDLIIKDNVHADYARFRNTLQIHSTHTPSGVVLGLNFSDVWEMSCMRYVGDKMQRQTVSQYLSDRAAKAECTRTANGDIQIANKLGGNNLEKRVFSKQHNYFFESKEVVDTSTGVVVYNAKVQSYVQSSGLSFPSKITSTDHAPDKRIPGTPDLVILNTTFSNVSINKPIAASVFGDHACKPGTVVVDTILQTVDVVDAGGVRRKSDKTLVDPNRQQAQSSTTESTSRTDRPAPTSTWVWLARVLGPLALVVGLVVGVRKFHRSRAASS